MREEGLGALAVVHAAVPHRGARRPDDDVAGAPARVPVAVLGDLVDDLVEGGEDVVRELDLGDGGVARAGEAHGEARDGLLRHRRVHHALGAEPVAEAHGATEDAAEADVLAVEHGLGVLLQRHAQGVVDRVHHRGPLRLAARRRRRRQRPRARPRRVHRRQRPVEAAELADGVVGAVLAHVLLHELPLLLQVPRHLRVVVREALLDRRLLLGLAGLEGGDDLLLGERLRRLLLLGVPDALGLEELAPPGDGALLLPLADLLLVLAAVRFRVVRRRVVANPVRHELDEDGRPLLHSHPPRLLRRGVDRDEVVTVDADGGDAEGRPAAGDAVAAVLVLHARGDGVAVVAADEERLRPVDRGHVQRRQRVALGGGAVAEVGHGDAVIPAELVGVARAGCLRHLGAEHRMHGLHVLVQHAVVDLQVAALAAVALVANVLVHDLLRGEAAPKEHAELPVLRPDHVLPLQGRGGAHAGSLLAEVRAVEADPALALHRLQELVVDGRLDHELVHLHALVQREGQRLPRGQDAALVHDLEDGELRAGAAELGRGHECL
mmetsp:Transcript_117771/g.329791  ORF Transcript_117771/g.329791 Transcript_117771/m.329791 type:complete len:551 (-) Transcript_117771:227-1879(-)